MLRLNRVCPTVRSGAKSEQSPKSCDPEHDKLENSTVRHLQGLYYTYPYAFADRPFILANFLQASTDRSNRPLCQSSSSLLKVLSLVLSYY